MSDKTVDKLLTKLFELEQEKNSCVEDSMIMYNLVMIIIADLKLLQQEKYSKDIQKIIDKSTEYVSMIEEVLFGRTLDESYVKGEDKKKWIKFLEKN